MPLRPNIIERRLIDRGTIPGILLDASMAAFTVEAVTAGMELGVFDELRGGPLDAESLADRTEADPEGIDILLRALVPLGYLIRDGDTYRLTNAARRSLPEKDLPAIGTFLKTQAREGLDATEAVREAPADGVIGWETVQSGEVGHGYQAMMRWLAADLVDPVVDAVTLPDGAERMLDVGGSHGLYTVRFCEEYPGLQGTIVDWPIGLEAAQQTLDERPGLSGRIDLVERDFEAEALPEGYDFAFLGQIVHGLTVQGNQALFEKLARATTERGAVAILDQVADPPSTSRLPFDPMNSAFSEGIAALLGFGLFVFTGGRSYPYDDLEAWLSEAGFSDVSYRPVRQSPGMSLVIGRKPGGE
jgi:hypothetical protein